MPPMTAPRGPRTAVTTNGEIAMTEKDNNDDDRLTVEEAYQLQKSDVPTNPFEALTTLAGLASRPRDDKEEG